PGRCVPPLTRCLPTHVLQFPCQPWDLCVPTGAERRQVVSISPLTPSAVTVCRHQSPHIVTVCRWGLCPPPASPLGGPPARAGTPERGRGAGWVQRWHGTCFLGQSSLNTPQEALRGTESGLQRARASPRRTDRRVRRAGLEQSHDDRTARAGPGPGGG